MKLNLQDYSSWISQELDKLVRPATTKAQRILDDSGRALGEAKGFFEDLSKKGDKDMSTKRDPVSYRAARLIGHSGREATQYLGRVQVPENVTWDELKAFKDSLSGLTRSLRDTRARTSAQLSGFYILDMRSFGGVSDRVGRQAERLSQFLEGDGSSLQKARILSSMLSDAQNVEGETVERRAELRQLMATQEGLGSRAASLARNVESLEAQGPLKELLDVEKSLRGESRHFRTTCLAHLKRPLRRLRDLSERGEVPLGLEEREALVLYIQSPYRSFLAKQSGPYLSSILGNLRSALVSGKLGFKPKKTTRVLAQLDQLISTDELTTRQSKGRSLLARRRELLRDSECRRLYDSRKEMLEKLAETKKEVSEVQERLESADQKLTVLDGRMKELLALLEAKTRDYTGKEVRIERRTAPAISAA